MKLGWGVELSGIAVVAVAGGAAVLVIATGAAFFVLVDMWLDREELTYVGPDPDEETIGKLPNEEEASLPEAQQRIFREGDTDIAMLRGNKITQNP